MWSAYVVYATICIVVTVETLIVHNTSEDTKDLVLCEEHLKQAEDGLVHCRDDSEL